MVASGSERNVAQLPSMISHNRHFSSPLRRLGSVADAKFLGQQIADEILDDEEVVDRE